MENTYITLVLSVLVLSLAFVNTQIDESKEIDSSGKQYFIKTAKGTRKLYHADYNKVSKDIHILITHHQSSVLGRRGSRLNLNNLPTANSGSINLNPDKHSRGIIRGHNKC